MSKGQAGTFSGTVYLIQPQLIFKTRELPLIRYQGDILPSLQTWEKVELPCHSSTWLLASKQCGSQIKLAELYLYYDQEKRGRYVTIDLHLIICIV